MHQNETPSHFNGKDALGHVIEAQAQGMIAAAEVHGLEVPGYISAASDAARDISVFLCLSWLTLSHFKLSNMSIVTVLSIMAVGLLIWKAGRSAWLGWFRLERLHRLLAQEKWEIEHHRQQERDELRVLYAAKGFEGKLLEEVLDVLMADNERLLKIMVEEEMGLTLASHEHPLKQGLGAAIGTILAALICLSFLWFLPQFGLIIGTLICIAGASWVSATLAQNDVIHAIIWNLSLAILAIGSAYFLLDFLHIFQGK